MEVSLEIIATYQLETINGKVIVGEGSFVGQSVIRKSKISKNSFIKMGKIIK